MRTFEKATLTVEGAHEALQKACGLIEQNLPLYTYKCQNHSSINGIYPQVENNQWTAGFWVGEVWLGWEYTKKPVFKQVAEELVHNFANRIDEKIEVDHHDMGFLYSPSCVAAYKLTGSEEGKKAALGAADQLISRFHEKGDFLQAWGALGAEENYRYIIDCLLNVPLLYWATEVSGDKTYEAIANRHVKTCLTHSIREDGSTYHTFFMNPETGEPVKGVTCQGYSDTSCWARGQAWGVYGIALSYRYTKNPAYLDLFDKVLQYYLERLPEDMVPYWDMDFIEGDEPRDSSSASIVACGLMEMAHFVDNEKADYYQTLARQMLQSIVSDYAIAKGDLGSGLVAHGTYSKKTPYNTCTEEGVDECVSWGDYFYMEALTRFVRDWGLYW